MAQNLYYHQHTQQYDPAAQTHSYSYSSYSQQQQQPYFQPAQPQYQQQQQPTCPQQQGHHRTPLPQPPNSPGLPPPPAAYNYSSYTQATQSHPSSSIHPQYALLSPTPSTPTSRRPLPNPLAQRRADTVPPITTTNLASQSPNTASPASRSRTPLHRPAFSVSSVPNTWSSSITPPASPPATTTAASPPRPLPQPHRQVLPRSVAQPNLVRNTSPPKEERIVNTLPPMPDASSAGQKFVPYWRNALPAPGQASASPQQGPVIERRSTVSGAISPTNLQRQPSTLRPLPQSPAVAGPSQTRSTFGHPLPPIPTQRAATLPGSSASNTTSPPRMLPRLPPLQRQPSPERVAKPPVQNKIEEDSDNEDLASHALLSRPQGQVARPTVVRRNTEGEPGAISPRYGVRNLPSRIRQTTSDSQAAHTGDSGAQSSTLRFAALSLQEENQQKSQPQQHPISSSPEQIARLPQRAHTYSQSVPTATVSRGALPAPPASPTRSSQAGNVTGRWPAGLPPLPKAPGTPDTRSTMVDRASPTPRKRTPAPKINLDDAPPPSLRRSPSPMRGSSSAFAHGDARPSVLGSYSNNAPSGSAGNRQPASIRTHALERAPSANSPWTPPLSLGSALSSRSPFSGDKSPISATTPSSAVSNISVFTLSSFPQPPNSTGRPLPRSLPSPTANGSAATSSVSSPTSAKSASSAFTLSSFPAPPPDSRNGKSASNDWVRNRGPMQRSTPEMSERRQPIPKISFPASADDDDSENEDDGDFGPVISVSCPGDNAPAVPSISISIGDGDDTPSAPQISLPGSSPPKQVYKPSPLERLIRKGPGLTCGGCGGAIVGRTVSAMGARWHPGCFRCCVCDELLENLSSYEHEGRAYCNLDYHELFAPKCYHCKTSIIDERYITLDDPELGKRTYHEQHFFCAECGDPFLDPKTSSSAFSGSGERTFSGDGQFVGGEDDVGFTVYRGHPYCEACHVRLRLPKCKRCKKPIRDGKRAVEALGGKWCWECFTCASCDQPFEDPSFFQREGKPFCERCFSIMIKNEL